MENQELIQETNNNIVSSEKLNAIQEEKRIKYIQKNIFKSKLAIGQIKPITKNKKGEQICFVQLVVPYDINNNFFLDNVPWEIYCYFEKIPKKVQETLNEGDLISFKLSLNDKNFVKVNQSTVKKMISYNEYLKIANIDPSYVKTPGTVGLEENEEIKVWATKEFHQYVTEFNSELIDKIKLNLKEIEEKKNEYDNLEEEIRAKREAAKEEINNMKAEAEEKNKQEELKLRKKEKELNKYEKDLRLLNDKLKYFGLKELQVNENIKKRRKIKNIDFFKLFEYIKKFMINKKNLIYSDTILRRFITAIQTNELIILSGPSGTGKTSIVSAFAEAVGGKAKIISVKPSWTESEDLIGFYNPIEKCYVSTPFLDAIVDAKREENKDKLYLICLDEMNLAHVEYYFAEFLSKLEINKENPSIELYSNEIHKEISEDILDEIEIISSKTPDGTLEEIKELCKDNIKSYGSKLIEIKKMIKLLQKYPAVFSIPDNVRFIGTINVDQTTKSISPKVIDRSFIIELLKAEQKLTDFDKEEIKEKFISVDNFNIVNERDLESSIDDKIITNLNEINNKLEIFECDYNNRTDKHLKKYLLCIDKWNLENVDMNEIESDLIAMKLLPRINTSFSRKADNKQKTWNELKVCSDNYTDDIKNKIEKMEKQLKEDNILSFWGTY